MRFPSLRLGTMGGLATAEKAATCRRIDFYGWHYFPSPFKRGRFVRHGARPYFWQAKPDYFRLQ